MNINETQAAEAMEVTVIQAVFRIRATLRTTLSTWPAPAGEGSAGNGLPVQSGSLRNPYRGSHVRAV